MTIEEAKQRERETYKALDLISDTLNNPALRLVDRRTLEMERGIFDAQLWQDYRDVLSAYDSTRWNPSQCPGPPRGTRKGLSL